MNVPPFEQEQYCTTLTFKLGTRLFDLLPHTHKRGELCGGNDAACDSTPGAGDGLCDACPVYGWVTADDEMLALLGSYYCDGGIDCVLPSELPRTLPPTLPGL